jgi:hypothetical protein
MEKEVLKETIREINPNSEKSLKKKGYKYKKKKETNFDLNEELVMRASEVPHIRVPKQAGSYKIGKSFHIFFEKKPKSLHRFFTKLLLGWEWKDQK